MEGLRKQALSGFKQLKFIPAPHEHELITISSPGAAPVRVAQPLGQMLQVFSHRKYTPPTLCLVKLRILHPTLDQLSGAHSVNASQDEMMQLWSLFDLDPTALHLLTKGIQGFNQHRPLSWDQDADAFYFMASSYAYSIVWTYRVATQRTSGVVVMRHKNIAGRDFELFWESLQNQTGIARHPLCPFVALAMQTMDTVYRGTLESQGQVASVEFLTGFSPFHIDGTSSGYNTTTANPQKPSDTDRSLETITISSRKVGAVLVHLEDDARQLRSLQRATDSLVQAGFPAIPNHTGEAAEVASAIQTLRQQMGSWEIRINYLRERAKNQLTVLFNLIARYDAASSIAIARAAKKDSASMKAIAIMTMVFLPGTFLAAVFAVPSLPEAGRGDFWVYWATAIPATMLVFAVQWMWGWLSGKRESREKGREPEEVQ